MELGDGWSLIETDTWLFRYSWVWMEFDDWMVISIQLGDGWSLMIETDTWLFRYSWVMDGV